TSRPIRADLSLFKRCKRRTDYRCLITPFGVPQGVPPSRARRPAADTKAASATRLFLRRLAVAGRRAEERAENAFFAPLVVDGQRETACAKRVASKARTNPQRQRGAYR